MPMSPLRTPLTAIRAIFGSAPFERTDRQMSKSKKTYVRVIDGQRPEIMIEVGRNEAVNLRAAQQLGLISSSEREYAETA